MKPGEFEQAMQREMGDLIRALQEQSAHIEAAQKTIDQNFQGAAADAQREKTAKKLAGLHAEVDRFHAVRQSLDQAANGLVSATKAVLQEVHAAEAIGLKVKDNWEVEPTNLIERLSMAFLAAAKLAQFLIHKAVDAWDTADKAGADLLNKAVGEIEREFWKEQPTVKDGEGKEVPIVVTQNGDIPGRSKPEDNHPPSDLNVTIPGWGHTVTGDAAPPLPPGCSEPMGALVDGQPVQFPNPGGPKNPDGSDPRALPTGANYGPDGKTPLVAMSFPTGGPDDGVAEYAGLDTMIFDMSDPKNPKPLGPLKESGNPDSHISQGSFAYDPQSRCMIAVGNVGNSDGSPRAVWKSDPIQPGDPPNKWMNSMHRVPGSEQPITPSAPGHAGGGDRENQVTRLPSGKWAVIDAKNGEGVRMYVADRPEDLFKGQPQLIAGVVNAPSPPVPAGSPEGATYRAPMAYGASITDMSTNPDGSDRITVRTSGWPQLVVPDPNDPNNLEKDKPISNYSPQTYTSTVQVGH
ncbi:hypothetical protein Srot_1915 [Segniliparus rotundus DSM 44985]|uniref:Uncharacterized protein n=2 Tax=Segniliparus rotundus TaxID=286802 RepID=D6Z8U4_SEGRD|nr:hypothetical protein Srot_1915 [Segniliparus rotundus DSM 44985]